MPLAGDSGSGRKIAPDANDAALGVDNTGADSSPTSLLRQDPPARPSFGWRATATELIGQVIDGKYVIAELIGTGGMGSVFKATQESTGRIVAVKVLLPHLANHATSLRRFQLEAKAASRISHRNSVAVSDFGVWQGQAYLVMDYLKGPSLYQLIKLQGKLSLVESLPIFRQACAGLGAAHKLGIFHRDVKPSNFICVASDEGPITKVCDFGLVKLRVTEGDTITGTGEVFGSPPYMSPEQCTGKRVDERSDIYGLGCSMFETLSGKVPIKGANPMDTMRKQLSVPPAELELEGVTPLVAEHMRATVEKTLAKDPSDRFQNMQELDEALLAVQQEFTNKKDRRADRRQEKANWKWDIFPKRGRPPFEK